MMLPLRPRRVRPRSRRSPAPWEIPVRLSIELLEDRCVLSELGNPAVIAAPSWTSYWWWRTAQIAAAPRGHPSVVFLGDSITDLFSNGPGTPVWNSRIAPLGAADYGVGGIMTQNILWQVDRGLLDGVSPHVAVLLIGTNNLSFGNTPEQTAAGVAADVADIRAHKPNTQVLLLGILPRGAFPDDPLRVAAAETNDLISQEITDPAVHYLDVGGSLLEPDGTLSHSVMADYLHPTTWGYEILTTAILPTLNHLLGNAPPASGSGALSGVAANAGHRSAPQPGQTAGPVTLPADTGMAVAATRNAPPTPQDELLPPPRFAADLSTMKAAKPDTESRAGRDRTPVTAADAFFGARRPAIATWLDARDSEPFIAPFPDAGLDLPA